VLTLDPVAPEQDTSAAAPPATGGDTAFSEPGPASRRPPTVATTPSTTVIAPPPVYTEGAEAEGGLGPVEIGETWLGLGAEFVTGLAPNPGRGVRLDLGTTLAGLRIGIWGSYDWVADRPLSQASFADVTSQLYRVRLWSGPAFRIGAIRLGPLVAL